MAGGAGVAAAPQRPAAAVGRAGAAEYRIPARARRRSPGGREGHPSVSAFFELRSPLDHRLLLGHEPHQIGVVSKLEFVRSDFGEVFRVSEKGIDCLQVVEPQLRSPVERRGVAGIRLRNRMALDVPADVFAQPWNALDQLPMGRPPVVVKLLDPHSWFALSTDDELDHKITLKKGLRSESCPLPYSSLITQLRPWLHISTNPLDDRPRAHPGS